MDDQLLLNNFKSMLVSFKDEFFQLIENFGYFLVEMYEETVYYSFIVKSFEVLRLSKNNIDLLLNDKENFMLVITDLFRNIDLVKSICTEFYSIYLDINNVLKQLDAVLDKKKMLLEIIKIKYELLDSNSLVIFS